MYALVVTSSNLETSAAQVTRFLDNFHSFPSSAWQAAQLLWATADLRSRRLTSEVRLSACLSPTNFWTSSASGGAPSRSSQTRRAKVASSAFETAGHVS